VNISAGILALNLGILELSLTFGILLPSFLLEYIQWSGLITPFAKDNPGADDISSKFKYCARELLGSLRSTL